MAKANYRTIAFGAALISGIFVACSSGQMPEVEQVSETTTTQSDAASTTAEITTTTETSLSDVAVAYFEDAAARRPTSSAEPGSPAELYAKYLVETRLTYGPAPEPTTALPQANSIIMRTSGEEDIIVDEIMVSSGGVVDFSIAGTPMSERIAAAEPSIADGVEVTGLIYRSTSGVRLVVVEAKNTSDDADLLLFWESDFTATADGRQESPMDASTPEIAPGATGVAIYQFDEVRLETVGEFLLSYAHRGPGETYTNPPRLTVPFP